MTYSPVRAPISDRIEAILIDYGIWSLFFIPVFILFVDIPPQFPPPWYQKWIVIGFNALFWLKDINGRSPGKRVRKLRVVRKRDNQTPNIIVLFIRNAFLILGIFELASMCFDKNSERLGETVTRTWVVKE